MSSAAVAIGALRVKTLQYSILCDLGDNTVITLNDLRKIICLRKYLKFLLKEFQFVMSLKILLSMAYTACHAPI